MTAVKEHNDKKEGTKRYRRRQSNRPDFLIFILALSLTAFGLIMVFSAGAPYAKSGFNDIYHFIKGQIFSAFIGILVMFVASLVPYRVYSKFAWIIFPAALILLLLTFVPQFSVSYADSRRWIKLGIEFQPSEIYKVALIILIAKLSVLFKELHKPLIGYVTKLSFVLVSAFIIYKQPHFSAAIIVALLGFILIFASGDKIWYMLLTVGPVVAVAAVALTFYDYMQERLDVWLDPFADVTGAGMQVVQSLYAIASGGLFGVGLGRSTQKFLYVPEPHNDFIFSIFAEELGYIGVLVLIAVFCMLLWRGIRVAILCEDMFGTLLATGISALIFLQAMLNMAVVTGLVPNTGIALPFVSFGGTSLVVFLGQIGILLNISKNQKERKAGK